MLVLELLTVLAAEIPELGQDPLSRADLLNFDDFSEVSLEELMEPERVRFSLNLFGSVGAMGGIGGPEAQERDATPKGAYAHFYQGTTSLLASGELGARVKMQTEIAFELEQGAEAHTEVERLYLRYTGKHGFLLLGRISNPIDFWNVAFHHGTWIQPSITRPLVLAYEHDSGILPTQAVGVFGGTNLAFPRSSLYFLLGISNGRGPEEETIQSDGDMDLFKQVSTQIYYTHGTLRRFRVGYSTWYDQIPVPDGPMGKVTFHEYGASLNFLYQSEHLMVLAEWFAVIHQLEQQTWFNESVFLHLGYRINHITPYTRVEWFAPRPDDPYFVSDPEDTPQVVRREGILGLRVDVAEWASLRAEYHLGFEDRPTHTGLIDLSFGI